MTHSTLRVGGRDIPFDAAPLPPSEVSAISRVLSRRGERLLVLQPAAATGALGMFLLAIGIVGFVLAGPWQALGAWIGAITQPNWHLAALIGFAFGGAGALLLLLRTCRYEFDLEAGRLRTYGLGLRGDRPLGEVLAVQIIKVTEARQDGYRHQLNLVRTSVQPGGMTRERMRASVSASATARPSAPT